MIRLAIAAGLGLILAGCSADDAPPIDAGGGSVGGGSADEEEGAASGDDGGEGGFEGETSGRLGDHVADFCAEFDRCEEETGFTGWDWPPCDAMLLGWLTETHIPAARDALALGRAELDDEAIAACGEALSERNCLDVRWWSDCLRPPVRGLVPPGGACAYDLECADGRCQVVEGECPGRCAALAGEGAACDPRERDLCAPGTYCSAARDTCLTLPGLGEPCADDRCAAPLRCVPAADDGRPVCLEVLVADDGGECDLTRECRPGFACLGSPGEPGVCEPVESGGTCLIEDPRSCPTDEYCGPEREFVVGDLEGPGRCFPRRSENEACDRLPRECGPRLRCAERPSRGRMCLRPALLGERCERSWECASEHCDQATATCALQGGPCPFPEGPPDADVLADVGAGEPGLGDLEDGGHEGEGEGVGEAEPSDEEVGGAQAPEDRGDDWGDPWQLPADEPDELPECEPVVPDGNAWGRTFRVHGLVSRTRGGADIDGDGVGDNALGGSSLVRGVVNTALATMLADDAGVLLLDLRTYERSGGGGPGQCQVLQVYAGAPVEDADGGGGEPLGYHVARRSLDDDGAPRSALSRMSRQGDALYGRGDSLVLQFRYDGLELDLLFQRVAFRARMGAADAMPVAELTAAVTGPELQRVAEAQGMSADMFGQLLAVLPPADQDTDGDGIEEAWSVAILIDAVPTVISGIEPL